MSSVQVNGITISYDVLGEGVPIVLIHGFASNRIVNWKNSGWYKYFLSIGRQVIALDLRGHGESQKLYDIQSYAPEVISTDILKLMDHLEVSEADIMGYSMGALLAVHLMGKHPKRFKSGVLGGIGSTVLTLKRHAEKIAQALTTKSPELITDPFLSLLRTFAEELNNDLRALVACNRAVHEQGAPSLSKISQPVLIVAGEKDDVAGSPDILVDRIPNAILSMIPGRNHTTLVPSKLFKEETGKFLRNGR